MELPLRSQQRLNNIRGYNADEHRPTSTGSLTAGGAHCLHVPRVTGVGWSALELLPNTKLDKHVSQNVDIWNTVIVLGFTIN